MDTFFRHRKMEKDVSANTSDTCRCPLLVNNQPIDGKYEKENRGDYAIIWLPITGDGNCGPRKTNHNYENVYDSNSNT